MGLIFHNCHVLAADGLQRDSSLRVVDGHIDAIGCQARPGDQAIDGGGGLLIPGLVDLHCDALEKILETRPGVPMPQEHVMPTADQLYASAGITTIYHAVSFADNELGVRSLTVAGQIAEDLHDWRPYGAIDHRLHARYEISDARGVDVVMDLIDRHCIDLVSVMDHSPGQGQFRDHASFIDFYTKTYKTSVADAERLAQTKMDGARDGWDRARRLMGHARQAGIPVASHDDDSPAKVRQIAEWGGTISEFPINLATVAAAHEAGLATVLGAPNVVRGGSQSGNMRALDAILAGKLDCLCADYVPWTMAAAACRLPELADCDLATAVALVAGNPARAVGLDDRGRLAPGLRADLVLLASVRDLPQIVGTWSAGRLAYRVDPPQVAAFPLPERESVA